MYFFYAGIYRRKYSAHIIYKNNQQFILENINYTTDAKALKSSDCLSDVESAALHQAKKSVGKKECLANQCIGCTTALKSRDKERHETFVRFLRFTRHALLAKVVENGGGDFQLHLLCIEHRMITLHGFHRALFFRKNILNNTSKSHAIM